MSRLPVEIEDAKRRSIEVRSEGRAGSKITMVRADDGFEIQHHGQGVNLKNNS